MIIAGIDIGSNTFRLLIADMANNRLAPLCKKMDTVRLGAGLAQSGVLSAEAMTRARNTLQAFQGEIVRWKPDAIRACGTAALRRATNTQVFLAMARDILGIDVEIITGEEEAVLSLRGAQAGFGWKTFMPMLKVDAGGGSTEFAMVSGPESAPIIASLPLGAVTLTEQFLKSPMSTQTETNELKKHVSAVLGEYLDSVHANFVRSPAAIVGSGGTATAMAALHLHLDSYDEKKVQGYCLSRKDLADIWHRLAGLTIEERNLLPGLEQGRSTIILAGMMIYRCLLEFLDADHFIVSDAGLLEGIVLSCVSDSHTVKICYS